MALQTVAQLAEKNNEVAVEVREQFGDRFDSYYMLEAVGADEDEPDAPVADEDMQGERKEVDVLAFFSSANEGYSFFEHKCKVVVDSNGDVWVDGEEAFTDAFL